jgi:amino acid transporter
MCRDGLFPRRLAHVHPRFGTPARLTIGFGILIALLAAFVPLGAIVELVNIGTLFAFVLANIGVIVLRRTRPDMERPFRVPFSPVFPIIGIAFCLYLMAQLPGVTWLRFLIWLIVGLIIYFAYSRRHSRARLEGCAEQGRVGVVVSALPRLIAAYKGRLAPMCSCSPRCGVPASGRPLKVVNVYPSPAPIGIGRVDAE